MKIQSVIAAPRGFSLVEVMVALVVMSVGLLGIARMQAAALSSTAVASTRSLAAIEAASLAASMHVNRGYWATSTVAASFTVQGKSVTPALVATPDCVTSSCKPTVMAAYDLQQWAQAVQAVLPPDYLATITCQPTATPPNCTIQITWGEKSVSLNTNGLADATSTSSAVNIPKYELYVEP
jgi:type IV pilus assembly protein PilV